MYFHADDGLIQQMPYFSTSQLGKSPMFEPLLPTMQQRIIK